MGNTVTYENGTIRISTQAINGTAPQINTEFVQNRLSQDEFVHFWDRLKREVGGSIAFTKIAIVLIIVIAIGFVIFQTSVRYFNPVVLIFYCISIISLSVGLVINTLAMRKKITAFVAKENNEIWGAKGLYWQFVRYGKREFLELRLAPSAFFGYQPPSQFPQPQFQGGMPNNYPQYQGNFYPQGQPGNYEKPILCFNFSSIYLHLVNFEQPQYQPNYGKQPQQYQGYQQGIQHPQYA